MSKPHLDWQTDVDSEWNRPEVIQEPGGKARGRVLPLLLLFLLLIATLAAIGLGQVARRVNHVNDETIAAIRTVHQLIHQSALTQDAELFRTLIYRRDGGWYESQQRLLHRHLFLDRAPLGLWAMPLTTDVPITITLSPDLQTALVAAALPYTAEITNGQAQLITLQQIHRYQKRNDYWLMSPLSDDLTFWGEWQTVSLPLLHLTYPARDATISQRLAEDLRQPINELCLVLACPDDFQLELRFTRDTDALWRLQQRPQTALRQIINLSTVYQMWLPTPTLVGLPNDEAGYAALRHGYTNWVATRMVAQFTDWSSVETETLLRELGLHVPYPVGYQPYQPPAITLADWPEQDVLVMCQTDRPYLYRYDVAAATWTLDPANTLWSQSQISWMRVQFLPLPDDASLLLWFEPRVERQIQHQYWHWTGETGTLLWDTPFAFPPDLWAKMLPAPDPANRYLPLVYPLVDANQEASFVYSRLSWDGLQEQRLEGARFSERPIWSPELNSAILVGADGGLAHTDAAATYRVYLGQGHSPFWLDEDTFGYVRYLAGNEWEATEVVLADRLDEQAIRLHNEVIATGNDLAAAAPFFGERNPLLIHQLLQNPANPASLLLLARTYQHDSVDMSYLFTLDATTGQLVLLAKDRRLGEPITFSPNGRYVSRMAYESAYWTLTAHDLHTGGEQQWTTAIASTVAWERRYDWSEDGRWLVLAEDDVLRLLAVGESYEQRVLLPEQGCYAVSWVDG